MKPLSFKRHRFPADVIRHAVWLYFRFSLSFRDVEELMCSYPIETIRGRYGGGVKVSDWYRPTRNILCSEQIALLKKLAPSL